MAEKKLIMVITLKTSGTQLRIPVEKFTVSKNQVTGGLRDIDWSGLTGTKTRLHWVNPDEVAAVHAEWEQ